MLNGLALHAGVTENQAGARCKSERSVSSTESTWSSLGMSLVCSSASLYLSGRVKVFQSSYELTFIHLTSFLH